MNEATLPNRFEECVYVVVAKVSSKTLQMLAAFTSKQDAEDFRDRQLSYEEEALTIDTEISSPGALLITEIVYSIVLIPWNQQLGMFRITDGVLQPPAGSSVPPVVPFERNEVCVTPGARITHLPAAPTSTPSIFESIGEDFRKAFGQVGDAMREVVTPNARMKKWESKARELAKFNRK